MVWPTRVRHRARKHAFEEALDEARLTPDAELEDFVDAALSNPLSQPAVGSLGDISVASGYVAPASLERAYGADEPPAEIIHTREPPGEAARKLKASLAGCALSPDELRRLRRRFATLNHPDKVPEALRAEAVAAMAEVNAEIDRALKRAERT
ncbi:hypothetical protein [Hyphomicrobium sp.]|uniref:hypothetical protein n=1 Tax=Hyphomicrobium sp. TaxID=82 RepID=UPI0025B92719|nr:hypothetical protein [Hyphomicrobium sp.]MCC7253310.1 hypothetical protein [Hyphomicrobium sp.]